MRKILAMVVLLFGFAIAACAPPAFAAESEADLTVEQFLALDTFNEPDGATMQHAVLNWYGAENYLATAKPTANKRSNAKERERPRKRAKGDKHSMRAHPLLL